MAACAQVWPSKQVLHGAEGLLALGVIATCGGWGLSQRRRQLLWPSSTSIIDTETFMPSYRP